MTLPGGDAVGTEFRELRRVRRADGILVGLDEVTYGAPGDQELVRDVVAHPGGVGVLPVDGEEVVLVRQFRAGTGSWVLEIPAGKRDRPGEPVESLAARELREEAGLEAGALVPLGSIFPSPAYTQEVIHIFAGVELRAVERAPDGVEEHHAELVRLPVAQAVAMAASDQIHDAKTVVALLRWAARTS